MQTQCNKLEKILLILKSSCTSRLRRFSKSESRSKEHGSGSAIKAGSNSSLAAGTLSLSSEVVYVDEEFGELLSVYPLERAIEDGVLVEVFKNRWQELSQGKPIVATRHLFSQVSLAGLLDIWNEYVEWRKNVMPTLPEADQMFVTTMDSEKVWLLEDGAAFTMLYPEDY